MFSSELVRSVLPGWLVVLQYSLPKKPSQFLRRDRRAKVYLLFEQLTHLKTFRAEADKAFKRFVYLKHFEAC